MPGLVRRMMSNQPPPIPVVSSIAPLAEASEAWLTDIWGVMHNGVTPFLEAAAACTRFREQGGIVLLLSNAPRPRESVAAQLDRIGVPCTAYDAILSSGDAARELVSRLNGANVFHLGPERDLGLYDGLEVRRGGADEAGAIVCTGLFDDERETAADYAGLLEGLAVRGLPMICANPDLTVERGHRIIPCAGALAEAYARLGGSVVYAGKPHLPIYEMAFDVIARLKGSAVPKDRMLAVGDGIRTDIKGAAAAGVRSVFIASGVHVAPRGRLDARFLDELFVEPGVRPVAAMAGLSW